MLKKAIRKLTDWLKRVRVSQFAKMGWLPKQEDKVAQLAEVLRFFGVASPEQWEIVWREHQVAYRQTKCFEASAESVSAWLRKSEIEDREIRCKPFDKRDFFTALDGIRDLTMEGSEVLQPQLVELLDGYSTTSCCPTPTEMSSKSFSVGRINRIKGKSRSTPGSAPQGVF